MNLSSNSQRLWQRLNKLDFYFAYEITCWLIVLSLKWNYILSELRLAFLYHKEGRGGGGGGGATLLAVSRNSLILVKYVQSWTAHI